ncbi:MAG: AEC family transporter [Alphaproteobacteria bacterium]|nr:AEC family transporter [Alphaproteobacteria bacterium]TAD91494.1 MAG: AEC family transporter [Alphaproteobacteria bacterium]
MGAVVSVGLPVFGLIFLGWVAARRGILGPASTDALNRFVYWFALPAMMFSAMFRVPMAELLNLNFAIAFCGGIVCTLVLWGLAQALVFRDSAAKAATLGHAAGYANTGYMGIPLAGLAFGPAGLAPAIIATVLTAAVVFAVGIIAIEAGLSRGGLGSTLVRIGRSLVTNPTLIAPALGALWAASGVPMLAPLKTFADILAGAAGPCALFALGLFLAGQPVRRGLDGLGWLVFLKLIVSPYFTWLIAFHVLSMEPLWAKVAVLMNALPTGAGAFVLAQQYGLKVAETSAVILVSTIVSVVTVSILLALYAG